MKPPKRIFLNLGIDDKIQLPEKFSELRDITWSEGKIYKYDIPYRLETVCEWKLLDPPYNNTIWSDKHGTYAFKFDKFCLFCGGKIKIKEQAKQ